MIIPVEDYFELYREEKCNLADIQQLTGLSEWQTSKIAKKLGIEIRKPNSGNKFNIDCRSVYERYQAGEKLDDISKDYNTSSQTLRVYLRKEGFKLKSSRQLGQRYRRAKNDIDSIIDYYQRHEAIALDKVAEKFGTSRQTIAKILKSNNINIKKVNKPKLSPEEILSLHADYWEHGPSYAHEKYGISRQVMMRYFHIHDLPINYTKNTSGIEREVRSWVEYPDKKFNRRPIEGLELDIYVPSVKLGIEVSGLYWHSTEFKDKDYHRHKYTKFAEAGIRVIQFWDYEVKDKAEIVKSIINKPTNVFYARKTRVVPLNKNNDVAKNFINKNHIQGFKHFNLGYALLDDQDDIRGVMTFNNYQGQWEISRLCYALNTIVVGGANKLFKRFVKDNSPKEVITYSDARLFTGKVYESIGFTYMGLTRTDYFYYHKDKGKLSRQQCQKHKLVKKGHNPDYTEEQIMLSLGYHRVYGVGNHKFKLTN